MTHVFIQMERHDNNYIIPMLQQFPLAVKLFGNGGHKIEYQDASICIACWDFVPR